jgi:transcriptional regulator with XRE-family HTH domain
MTEVWMRQIRELRAERGLTQVRLAVAADMNPATLNRIEQGKANPNIKTLERLANALGVGVGDLLEDDSKKAQAPLWSDESTERRPELSWEATRHHAEMGALLAEVWGPELEEREEARDLEWLMRVAQILTDYGVVLKELLGNTTLPDKETAEEVAFMAMDLNAFFAKVEEALPRVKEAREREVEAMDRSRR